jgi:transposase
MVPDLAFPPHSKCSLRPGYRGTSLQAFYSAFPNEEACIKHIFECRYDEQTQCRKCGRSAKAYPIKGTKRFQLSCGHGVWPLTGTIFSASTISVQLWLYAMLHFCNSAEGVNSLFLGRQLGICHKAAWRMGNHIRWQMAALENLEQIGVEGEVIHIRLERLLGVQVPGDKKRQVANVLLIADRSRVSSFVLGRPRRTQISGILKEKCARGVVPVTCCYLTYRVSTDFGTRRPLAEFVPEYFSGGLRNTYDVISGFNGYFRRPLKNNYRRVSLCKLWLYLKEFEFRFNRRQHSDRTFWNLASQFPDLEEASLERLKSIYSKVP